ncbi:hypothetical protein CPC08DRAFT_217549 [Agrocybe pediades]|nr:hypothetical protein CPC08DRAFT_217549 [Agrocybe pediades]
MTSNTGEHPLALELQNLRASVLRFQDEAHQTSVKLQRHSLDSTRAHERAVYHERENDALKAEIAILRANPLSSSAGNPPMYSCFIGIVEFDPPPGNAQKSLEKIWAELTFGVHGRVWLRSPIRPAYSQIYPCTSLTGTERELWSFSMLRPAIREMHISTFRRRRP